MKKILFSVFLFVTSLNIQSQDSTKTNPLTISGYVELYYSYDFGNPSNHEKPSFLYNFNRHNEVNVNLGFIKAAYAKDRVRGNLALMGGTYTQYNLAAEQALLRNIFEANAGVKLSKDKNIWLDAGIMPSHLGAETPIGKDCANLTRSMAADNSPYYECGVKIAYTSASEKIYLAAMYLNGWQKIQKTPGNQTPAFGTQLTLKPNKKFSLNWSTYVGNEFPDSLKRYRIFNDFYGQLNFTEKFALIFGFDYGIEQVQKHSNVYNNWYTPNLILRYQASQKIRIAARLEYYSDRKGVIIPPVTPVGFQTFGYSLNMDYAISKNIMWRIEGRLLNSKDKIFTLDNQPNANNYCLTTSLALNF